MNLDKSVSSLTKLMSDFSQKVSDLLLKEAKQCSTNELLFELVKKREKMNEM